MNTRMFNISAFVIFIFLWHIARKWTNFANTPTHHKMKLQLQIQRVSSRLPYDGAPSSVILLRKKKYEDGLL